MAGAAYNRRDRINTAVVETGLWLCSYAPLFAILAIRFRDRTLWIICASLAVVGVAFGLALVARYKRVAASSVKVRTIEDRGREVSGYVATYLLPFVTAAEPSTRDLIAYALFLVILAIVYVRSDMLQINPTLYIFRWRLFAVTIGETQWPGFVLSRLPLHPNQVISATRITDRLFISYKAPE